MLGKLGPLQAAPRWGVGVRNGQGGESFLLREEPFCWTAEGGWEARLASRVPDFGNGGLRWVGAGPARRLEMRVRLRPGLRWQDGTALGADDLLFAHGLLSDPDFPAFDRGLLGRLESVSKIGPLEALYRFRPGPMDLQVLDAARVAPRHCLEGVKAGAWLEDPRVSACPHAGPYRRVGGEAGVDASYEAVPGYVMGAPAIPRLLERAFAEPSALLQAARQGRVDLAQFGYNGVELLPELEALAAQGRYRLVTVPAASDELLVPNLDHPFLREKAVRRALLLGMDREAIRQGIFHGAVDLPSSWLPPSDPAALKDLKPLPFDPDAARALLAQAGFRAGADGILLRGGRRFEFELWYASGNRARDRLLQAVARDWKALGVLARLRSASNSEVYARDGRSVMVRRAFDMLAWQVTLGGDQPYSLRIWQSSEIPGEAGGFRGQNYAGWRNADSDRLMAEALAGPDDARRRRALERHQRLFAEELPALPVYSHTLVYLVDRRLEGFRPGRLVIHPPLWNAGRWVWREEGP